MKALEIRNPHARAAIAYGTLLVAFLLLAPLVGPIVDPSDTRSYREIATDLFPTTVVMLFAGAVLASLASRVTAWRKERRRARAERLELARIAVAVRDSEDLRWPPT